MPMLYNMWHKVKSLETSDRCQQVLYDSPCQQTSEGFCTTWQHHQGVLIHKKVHDTLPSLSSHVGHCSLESFSYRKTLSPSTDWVSFS